MARTPALSITTNGTTKDQLAEIYDQVIDNFTIRALSAQYKANVFTGDPTAGSVEFDRFKNAAIKAYGTARAAGKGDYLVNNKIVVNLDQDKEIVEEVEQKDIQLFGLPSIMAKRAANHDQRVAASMDTLFFGALETAATAVTLTAGTKLVDQVEAVVQTLQTTQNDFVDGIDRDNIVVSVKPSVYGRLHNYLNTINDGDSRRGTFGDFNGVEVVSNPRQTSDVLAFIDGAVAQPIYTSGDYQEQTIPLSSAKASAIFFHYGTKVLTPDLVYKATLVSETA